MELGFEEPDLHVVIRVPWKRPSTFKPPSQAIWSEEVDQELWKALSRQKEETIDWEVLSREFNTTIPQLLRHSATLYEKKLRELLQTKMPTSGFGNPPSTLKDSRCANISETQGQFHNEIFQDKKHLAAIQKSYYDALKLERKGTVGQESPSHSETKLYVNDEEQDDSDENEEITEELLNEKLSRLQVGMPSGLQKAENSMVSNGKVEESEGVVPSKGSTQPEVDEANHSAGSSFSDLSDSSVTQSAMEDAYLSKFNQSRLSMVSKKSQFLSSLLK